MIRFLFPLAPLLVILCLPCKAQSDFRKGFVITNANDSLPGYVAYRTQSKNHEACYFRETIDGEATRYSPGEIKAYGIAGDKRYASQEIPLASGTKTVFVQSLINSKMSLFRYKESYFVATDKITLLPKKSDVKVYTEQGTNYSVRPGKKYIGLLNYLLLDCSLSANEADYRESDIAPLVLAYNSCKKSPAQYYTVNKPATAFNWQLLGGWSTSFMRLEQFEKNFFSASQTGMFGVSMELSAPRSFDKSFLSVEIMYNKLLFHGYSVRDAGNPVVKRWYDLDAEFLKVPIGFRHNFLSKARSPYIKAGFVEYICLNSRWTRKTEVNDNGTIDKGSETRKLIDQKQAGIWLAVGYTRQFSKTASVFGEIRYEKCYGLATINDQEATITSINFLAGLRF